jgi:hypothetical protein
MTMNGIVSLFLPRPPPSITPRADALCCVATTLRLSFRAITVVFVFSRASVFSMRTSSFVHGRLRVIFFAMFLPTSFMLRYCGGAILSASVQITRTSDNARSTFSRPPSQ